MINMQTQLAVHMTAQAMSGMLGLSLKAHL